MCTERCCRTAASDRHGRPGGRRTYRDPSRRAAPEEVAGDRLRRAARAADPALARRGALHRTRPGRSPPAARPGSWTPRTCCSAGWRGCATRPAWCWPAAVTRSMRRSCGYWPCTVISAPCSGGWTGPRHHRSPGARRGAARPRRRPAGAPPTGRRGARAAAPGGAAELDLGPPGDRRGGGVRRPARVVVLPARGRRGRWPPDCPRCGWWWRGTRCWRGRAWCPRTGCCSACTRTAGGPAHRHTPPPLSRAVAALPGPPPPVAVGRPAGAGEPLRASYLQARHVATLQGDPTGILYLPAVAVIDELGPMADVLSTVSSGQLVPFVQRVLGGLLADTRFGGELAETLYAYLTTGGSPQEAGVAAAPARLVGQVPDAGHPGAALPRQARRPRAAVRHRARGAAVSRRPARATHG